MTRVGSEFKDKVALITGGAGDIGRAAALRLADGGARIAIIDLDEAAAQAAAKQLVDTGHDALALECNVVDEGWVQEVVAQVVEHFGQINLLFNNAGYQGAFAPTHTYPSDDFRRVLDVNVMGVFHVLKAVAAHMVANGSGSIVNSASFAGVQGPPNMVAYAASKFAVVGITQSASKDLAPKGVRVNSVSPGLIGPGKMWDRQVKLQAAAGSQYFPDDPAKVEQLMIGSVPLRRLGSLGEVADSVAFLLSDAASFITGFNIELTGGQ